MRSISNTRESLEPSTAASGVRSLSDVAVALVEPEFPLNVGYVGRTMANFGIECLYVVSSRPHPPEYLGAAMKFASHGELVVKSARRVSSLAQLRRSCSLLVGTTAIRARRKSNITRKTMGLDQAASVIARIIIADQSEIIHRSSRKKRNRKAKYKVCFVFGRDTTGLTNEELRACDYNLTISTGTKYNTLNISHAAAILFYSVRRQVASANRSRSSLVAESKGVKEDRPTRTERQRVLTLFLELAKLSDFQNYKQGRLEEALNRLLNRSDPSLREIYLLMGLASKAASKIKTLSQELQNTQRLL